MASVPLSYKYLFLYNFLFIHPKVSIGVLKRQFELSEASVHWCFEKITAPKIYAYFAYFPAKHPGCSSVEVHSQAFLGFFQKALYSNYSVENLLAPVSVKSSSAAHVISAIFKNFKNMQGKAGGCNSNTCNSLKGTP